MPSALTNNRRKKKTRKEDFVLVENVKEDNHSFLLSDMFQENTEAMNPLFENN